MRTLSALVFVTAISLGHAPCAQALEATVCRIGDIARVFGEVKVIRNGTTLMPVAGEAFCARDRFLTGSRGVAELKFRDGTAVTVGKDAEFAVLSWKERRWFANEATFELLKGAFRSITGAITTRRHRYEVRTAIATIGVRGTDFWGGMNLEPGVLDVLMLEGKGVYIENAHGRTEIGRAGEGVSARADKAPSSPSKWTGDKVRRAVSTVTP